MSVKITGLVYKQIKAIQSAGLTDMNNPMDVAQQCKKCGFDRAAYWILGNPERYLKAITEGMDIC